MTQITNQLNAFSGYRFHFNGQESDNEVAGSGNAYDFGERIYSSRIGRFLSVDGMTKSFPMLSTYQFASNCPISGIDLDGLEFYYTADGKLLGKIGTSTEVRIVKKNDVDAVQTRINQANTVKNPDEVKVATNEANKMSISLGVTNELLVAFAAMITKESSGEKEESYAIGNATMNFLDAGGSKQLQTLEDVVMYDNTFAQGATQSNYTNFKTLTPEGQNSEYGLGAAINAIGFSNNVAGFGFSDYSGGADSWDGIDLISTKHSNDHRGYSWSLGSKDILSDFKKNNNGGVKVADWTYKAKGYQIEATKTVGKTLFTDIKTGRGEGKQSKNKFK
jgi:RHS repeat-associated protein